MIVNESIELKIKYQGKTTTKIFKNRILDNYLNKYVRFTLQNLVGTEIRANKSMFMKTGFIDFTGGDTITDTSLDMSNKDVRLDTGFQITGSIINTKTGTTIQYIYGAVDPSDLIPFEGSKIYGIGFGNYDYFSDGGWLFAYLDLSEFDIYYMAGMELSIVRQDTLSTDWECSGITPYHLCPDGKYLSDTRYRELGLLTSIGLGFSKDITEATMTSPVVSFTGVGEATITGTLALTSRDTEVLYPSDSLYPSEDLYPLASQYTYARVKYGMYFDRYILPTGYVYFWEDYYLSKQLRDLDISYNGETVTIKYKIERGT